MTREEEIGNAIDTILPIPPSEKGRKYEQALMATGFEAGVKWADHNPKSPWISVKDDLPCNHEELIDKNFKSNFIKTLFVVVWYDNHEDIDCMISENGEWRWLGKKPHTHWMLIPKPPKVGD